MNISNNVMSKSKNALQIAICITTLFLVYGAVHAQSEVSTGAVFDSISSDDRTKIVERYDRFIKSYTQHKFLEVYSLLSVNYLRGTQFTLDSDFVEFKQRYYSDPRTRFVSFVPHKVDEITQGTWMIRGCLTEFVDGKRSRLKSTLNVWKERDNYYFSDFSLVVISLNGTYEKCS